MADQKKETAQSSNKLTLATLRPAQGSVRTRLRVGRGIASGAGKTCNRGHRGQGQRSGESQKRGFEGGQMPLYRRLPHLAHFKQPNKRHWLELNVSDVARYADKAGDELTYEKLEELGVFNPYKFDGIRLLGNGELNRQVKVEAHYATPSAKEKIEQAGGQVVQV